MLLNNTLKVLEEGGVPKSKITIFLANKDELKDYKQKIKGYKFVVGVKGLGNQRNFMMNYYPEGKYIISMDDDIEKIIDIKGNPVRDLPALFQRGYDALKQNNAFLWGPNKSANPFYLKDNVSDRFNLIQGPFFGYINRRDADLRADPDYSIFEDIDRTIKHWIKDGVVIRLNDVGYKTNFRTNTGGLQSTNPQREAESKVKAYELMKKYPTLIKDVVYQKKSDWYIPVLVSGYPRIDSQ
jgi:hypothetical protein